MLVDTVLCEVQPPKSGGAQWVHLLTHGEMSARDGRRFVLADAAAVVERTLARAGKAHLPIDYEHQTDLAAENGRPAPAAGWISQLSVRADGIWALVDWTAKARAMLAAREYRYISPTFMADKDTGTVRVILRAALTNNPALELTALASARLNGEPTMKLPIEITKALGLLETATADDAVTAIKALSGPTPEMASTLAAMATVVKELNALKQSSGSRNVTAKVDTAMKSGVFPPALRGWAMELCSSNEALFDTFVEKTGKPFAHLATERTYDMSLATGSDETQTDSSTDAMIAQQLGISPAKMKA